MSRITIDRGVHVVAIDEPKRSRRKWLFLGIGALVAAGAVGTTLAASITINSSQPIEFGQGVVAAGACDADMQVSPRAAFTSTGTFVVDRLELDMIDFAACAGKTIRISARDGSGTEVWYWQFAVKTDGSDFENDIIRGAQWTVTSNPDGSEFDVVMTQNLTGLTSADWLATSDFTRFTIQSS